MPRILLLVLALSILISLVTGGHFYIAKRLVLEAGLEPWLSTLLCWSIAGLGFSLVLQPIAERLFRPRLSRLIAWPASLWMGLAFLLVQLLAFSDLVLWLGGQAAFAAQVSGGEAPAALGRTRAVLVLLVALLTACAALRSGLAPPRLRRVEIALPHWPASLDGFRIVQICDIHIGSLLDRRFARHLVDRVNSLDPDLVAVTGDLVDGSVSKLAEEVAPFALLGSQLLGRPRGVAGNPASAESVGADRGGPRRLPAGGRGRSPLQPGPRRAGRGPGGRTPGPRSRTPRAAHGA
jgi:hypothetical protein